MLRTSLNFNAFVIDWPPGSAAGKSRYIACWGTFCFGTR